MTHGPVNIRYFNTFCNLRRSSFDRNSVRMFYPRHLYRMARSSYLLSFLFILAQQPPVGQGLLIHDVATSHMTHHSRYDSSGRLISSSLRPLPDNTDINASSGMRNQNLSRLAAADPHLRPRGHWDRLNFITIYNSERKVKQSFIT